MFVHALKAGGYFTGDESSYANSVASIALGFYNSIGFWNDPQPLRQLDPANFSEWQPITDVSTALTSIFGTDYIDLAHVLCDRYDCEETNA
jgi:hypothetical protein